MVKATNLQLDFSDRSLPVFEALASPVRLKILRHLSQSPANVQQLAEMLGLSSAIVTMHVRKLEEAQLICCTSLPGRRGRQKLCTFELESMSCDLPSKKATRGLRMNSPCRLAITRLYRPIQPVAWPQLTSRSASLTMFAPSWTRSV